VSVDLDYVMQSYLSVPDDAVSVSETEIAKLYNERKNTFKQEEVKIIDYIAVPILPSEQDYQSVLDRMEKVKTRLTESEYPGDVVMENNSEVPYLDAFVAYNQLTNSQKYFVDNSAIHAVEGPVLENNTYSMYKLEGETIAPDSIKLNVLALPATDDEKFVTHLGDSLIQVIKGGKTFADMAQEVTGGRSDGSAGWQTEASLLQQTQNDVAFKKAAFAAPLNETQIIKSSMGSYLVQVVERTASVKKYKIATVQIPVVPSQTTKTRLYNDLNQYIASHHNLATFKDSAVTAGYNIQKEVEVGKKQMGLSNIQNSRQVIQWAFKSDKGAISDIYECQNQEYFVVAAVEGGLKEGFRPLASVSDVLKRELINDKKAEKIIADLKAKNPTTLDEYAAAMNTNPQSVNYLTFATQNISGGVGVEPVINVEATVAPVGKVSGPYKGNRGVYVINVTNRRDGETPFDANMQKQTMQMQYGYRLYQLFQSNQLLKEGAKIEDHYDRFF
jgi:peptidyl-prolyl cis-trans isomerase D